MELSKRMSLTPTMMLPMAPKPEPKPPVETEPEPVVMAKATAPVIQDAGPAPVIHKAGTALDPGINVLSSDPQVASGEPKPAAPTVTLTEEQKTELAKVAETNLERAAVLQPEPGDEMVRIPMQLTSAAETDADRMLIELVAGGLPLNTAISQVRDITGQSPGIMNDEIARLNLTALEVAAEKLVDPEQAASRLAGAWLGKHGIINVFASHATRDRQNPIVVVQVETGFDHPSGLPEVADGFPVVVEWVEPIVAQPEPEPEPPQWGGPQFSQSQPTTPEPWMEEVREMTDSRRQWWIDRVGYAPEPTDWCVNGLRVYRYAGKFYLGSSTSGTSNPPAGSVPCGGTTDSMIGQNQEDEEMYDEGYEAGYAAAQDACQSQINDLQDQLSDALASGASPDEINQLQNALADAQADYNVLLGENAGLQSEVEALVSQLSECQSQLSVLELSADAANTLEAQLDDCQTALAQAQQDGVNTAALEQQVADLQQQLAAKEGEMLAAMTGLGPLLENLAVCEAALATLEAERADLRAQLENQRDQDFTPILDQLESIDARIATLVYLLGMTGDVEDTVPPAEPEQPALPAGSTAGGSFYLPPPMLPRFGEPVSGAENVSVAGHTVNKSMLRALGIMGIGALVGWAATR